MRRRLALVFLSVLAGRPAAAQDEDVLRRALEGKYVTVKLDLPASEKGLDLRFDREEPFNSQEHFARIRDFDVAVPQGQRVQISLIKLKGDHVEFQLAGGGFDWIKDGTTQTFVAESKSGREKDLDDQIKNESDRSRKRDLEDERDHLRRERERRDDRRRREIEEHNVEARERDHERALRSGSRINLRFKKHVPPDALTPEGLLHYLGPWVSLDEGRPSHARR